MPTTLAFIRQRLATLRAAVDELADLAAEAEQAEAAGTSLLPTDTQAQLLLDLDRIGERLEQIGEAISGSIDPRMVRPDAPVDRHGEASPPAAPSATDATRSSGERT